MRTNFSNFGDEEECEKDRQKITAENEKLAEIVKSCNEVIYVNNPSVDVDDKKEMDINKEKRRKSREVLLNSLQHNCQGTYKLPQIIEELNEKISDPMTRIKELEERLDDMMKKIEEKNEETQSLIQERRILEESKKKEEELINQQEEEKFREKWQKYAEGANGHW